MTVVALGQIGDLGSINIIKKGLNDSEVNVQWGAAISLAQMGDPSGKEIIGQLLDRQYLAKFPEVDPYETNQLIMTAIESAMKINDGALKEQIGQLARSDENMNVRSKAMNALR